MNQYVYADVRETKATARTGASELIIARGGRYAHAPRLLQARPTIKRVLRAITVVIPSFSAGARAHNETRVPGATGILCARRVGPYPRIINARRVSRDVLLIETAVWRTSCGANVCR